MNDREKEIISVKEKKLTTLENIFTLKYGLLDYERSWLPGEKYYEPSARIQAELAGGIKDGNVVIDLGCGTGNSTFVLASSNPEFARIFAIDPSQGFLRIAQYKFGKIPEEKWEDLIKGLSVDSKVIENIQRIKEKSKSFNDKVEIIRSRGDQLPLLSDSVDRIHCVQSLHWMGFADNDIEGNNISHLKLSLNAMRRVLKLGGVLIFDESGFHFDFGEAEHKSQKINDLHILKHPFNLEFVENLYKVFQERGFGDIQTKPEKVNKYYHMFNLKLIQTLLLETGFKLELINGKPYKFHTESRNKDDLLNSIRVGSSMDHFTTPGLLKLSDEEKTEIINQALEETVKGKENLLETSSMETYAFFVAKAV